jgi:curved DNA binding protein
VREEGKTGERGDGPLPSPPPLTASLHSPSTPPPPPFRSDLGVHLDGHIALVAHTVVLGASAAAPVTGARADVLAAAHAAAEIALRLIKPGVTNSSVTAAFEKVAEAYGVRAIAGMSTHQLGHFQLEGPKKIALKADPEAKTEASTFAANESYAIDVSFSSGEGKPRELEARTTVFRRNPEVNYHLKMKASRWLVTEAGKKSPTLAFTLRSLGDDKEARLGVSECMNHGLFTPYQVVHEKEGAAVAHVRFTVLLLNNGTQKVTGLELPDYVQCAKSRECAREEGRKEGMCCVVVCLLRCPRRASSLTVHPSSPPHTRSLPVSQCPRSSRR